MNDVQSVTLNNGVELPLEGFGVYQVNDPSECERVVAEALQVGYRLLDTAAAYANEEAVGRAIRASGIPREEIFVTTKLWVQDAGEKAARSAFQASLAKLGVDYVDLYLVHQPFGDYYGAWRAMEHLAEEGLARAIGVSNFTPERLTDLVLNNRVPPAVNQIECHPFLQQHDAMATMADLGVRIQAWGPFAEGKHGIFTHPVLSAIGERYQKSPAQVALRWNVQRGVVVLPKSVTSERIRANLDIWDFALDRADMDAIAALDKGRSEIIDHADPAVVRMINGLRIHD